MQPYNHETIYKKGRVNTNSRIISTDEDPSLQIESLAIVNLRGVSTKLNKCIPSCNNHIFNILHKLASLKNRIVLHANCK